MCLCLNVHVQAAWQQEPSSQWRCSCTILRPLGQGLSWTRQSWEGPTYAMSPSSEPAFLALPTVVGELGCLPGAELTLLLGMSLSAPSLLLPDPKVGSREKTLCCGSGL